MNPNIVAEESVPPSYPERRLGKSFVFIIGFNKTGTKSLNYFFMDNNFSSIHWDDGRLARALIMNLLDGRAAFYGYDEKYEVFSDFNFLNRSIELCGSQFYRHLDRDYPGSFFIYKFRPLSNWIRSRLNHRNEKLGSFKTRYLSSYNLSRVEDLEALWKKQRERFELDIRRIFPGEFEIR